MMHIIIYVQTLEPENLNIRIILVPLNSNCSCTAEYVSKTSLYKTTKKNSANITCRPRPTSLWDYTNEWHTNKSYSSTTGLQQNRISFPLHTKWYPSSCTLSILRLVRIAIIRASSCFCSLWCSQGMCKMRRRWRVIVCKIKGKAIPLQAWTGPEDSRRLRLLDFKTIGTWRR